MAHHNISTPAGGLLRGASIIAVETVRHKTGSIADIAEEIR
jgi:hypothetical protein